MINGFSLKRIQQETTLGERLKTARQNKEISLTEAEANTKVRAKYLSALESGKWEVLPQQVYSRGFVMAYARFLQLPLNETLGLFERESSIYQSREGRNLAYQKTFRETKVLITPKLLAYFATFFFVVSMVSYIVYQVAGFAGSPSLQVLSPENNMVLEKDSIDLAGVTDNDALVMVNDQNIPVTSDGRFSQNLRLHRGVNVISVKAINKAKKESAEVYTVEYRPKTAEAIVPQEQAY